MMMIGKKATCSPSFKYGDKLLVLLIFICFVQHYLLIHQLQSIPTTPTTAATTIEESSTLPSSSITGGAATVGGRSTPLPPCIKNPYLGAMEPLSNITKKMDEWFENLDNLGTKSMQSNMFEHNHERFFPFDELTTCKKKSCVGGKCSEDNSKVICGLDELRKQVNKQQYRQKKNANNNNNNNTTTTTTTKEEEQGKNGCIVYSIGGNNEWKFEKQMLKRTPCEIHTFDCTGPRSRFKVPQQTDGRLHFHHVCISPYSQKAKEEDDTTTTTTSTTATTTATATTTLSSRLPGMVGESWTLLEMQQRLGHKRIDLLKIDVEGFEFPLFASWPELYYEKESENLLLPMQILVEVHYQTYFPTLHPDGNDFKTATDLLEFQSHLMRMGYVVTVRDDNPFCLHCTELTLVRARCPNTGVYANL